MSAPTQAPRTPRPLLLRLSKRQHRRPLLCASAQSTGGPPARCSSSSGSARSLVVVQRDNAETDELRAGGAWRSSGAGSGPAGGCSWAIASAAVRERRDRRRHARGYVREWTFADRHVFSDSSHFSDSVGKGERASGSIVVFLAQPVAAAVAVLVIVVCNVPEVDSSVSTGATQWRAAGRTAARLPHLTGKMISLECSVSANRRSGSDGPRPRVSAGVGAPACSRGCMGRAHRREWGLIVK